MPLGMQVSLGPDHVCQMGIQLPQKGTQLPILAKPLGGSISHLVRRYSWAGLGPGHIVFDETQLPLQKGTAAPYFRPTSVWPNGWMDQDATLYGSASAQATLCLMGTQLRPRKGALQQPPSALFGPCPLCSNSWMDQDITGYGGRSRPRRHCVRWGVGTQISPRKGTQQPPLFGPCLLWPNGRPSY